MQPTESESGNGDLESAFSDLVAEDSALAPPFPSAEGPLRRWKLRPAGLAAWAGIPAAVVAGLVHFDPSPQPAEAPDAIAFEELSRVISREVFASSAGSWRSPTDFLLELPTSDAPR